MNAGLWCDRFREHLRVSNYSEATIYEYGREVGKLCEFLGEREVTEPHQILRDDVVSYQLFLLDIRKPDGTPLAPGTRVNKLKALLSFLRYLKEAGFVLSALDAHVKSFKPPDSLPPELPDEEQVFRLLEEPNINSPCGRRDRALLELLYACALRNTELRSLLISDVDLHRLELTVRKGKGNKSRLVPLSETAAVWLEEYLSRGRPLLETSQSGGFLFLNTHGRRLRRDTLSRIVQKYARAAGLSMKVTPHLLRHSCATHMLSRKAGLRHLQKFLGHASVSSTERYARVDVSDLREVLMQCHPRESL